MNTADKIKQEANRLYPLMDNPENDLAIREYNQRQFDKINSFITGTNWMAKKDSDDYECERSYANSLHDAQVKEIAELKAKLL
jgi:hypothetical protein